jgi:hypothetical protein
MNEKTEQEQCRYYRDTSWPWLACVPLAAFAYWMEGSPFGPWWLPLDICVAFTFLYMSKVECAGWATIWHFGGILYVLSAFKDAGLL